MEKRERVRERGDARKELEETKVYENGNGRRKAIGKKKRNKTMTLEEKTRIPGRWKDQKRRKKECESEGRFDRGRGLRGRR